MRRRLAAAAVLIIAVSGSLGAGAAIFSAVLPADPFRVLTPEGRSIVGPRDVAAAGGLLYVVDSEGWLRVLDYDGGRRMDLQLVKTVRGFPAGVSVEPDGNVLIADTHEARVRRLTPEGEEIGTFGRGLGSEPGQFVYPQRTLRLGDEVFVTEFGYEVNNRVQVFSTDGPFLRAFGTYGTKGAAFARPEGIALLSSGDLLVVDSASHRLTRWTPEGRFVAEHGREGRAPGELRYPYGCAADADHVYVTEDANNRVSRFSHAFRFEGCYGETGSGPGQFLHPRGIAVADGNLFVADTGNDRVVRLALDRIPWRSGR